MPSRDDTMRNTLSMTSVWTPNMPMYWPTAVYDDMSGVPMCRCLQNTSSVFLYSRAVCFLTHGQLKWWAELWVFGSVFLCVGASLHQRTHTSSVWSVASWMCILWQIHTSKLQSRLSLFLRREGQLLAIAAEGPDHAESMVLATSSSEELYVVGEACVIYLWNCFSHLLSTQLQPSVVPWQHWR